MELRWETSEFHGQQAEKSLCGNYHIFWSDDACCFLVDAPNTNSHGGWGTLRQAKRAMQEYEDNGRSHTPADHQRIER